MDKPSPEFYKAMYEAETVCWCGGKLKIEQDGLWYIQKCATCGKFIYAYMVMPMSGYAT